MLQDQKKIGRRQSEYGVYESFGEACDHIYESVMHAIKTNSPKRQHFQERMRGDEDWVGRSFAGPDDWKSKVDQTWEEGFNLINKMIRELESQSDLPKPISRRRRRTFDEYDGDDVSYDRLRSGQPFWSRGRRLSHPGPTTFTVIADASSNCGYDPNQILWKGATGVAIAKVLEAAGYRVDLWLTMFARDVYIDGCDDLEAIKLKDSKEPLNIAALSTAVPGWFYRTGIFALMVDSKFGRTADWGLGYPNYNLTKEQVECFTNDPNYLVTKAMSLGEAKRDLSEAVGIINNLQKAGVR